LITGQEAKESAQAPIPNNYPGHNRGNATAPILFELFYDHLCPDSLASWPVIKQVFNAFPGQIHLIVHIFPLPYHRNAFYAAQGGLAIEDMKGEDAWFQWMELLFANQANFYNDATADMTSNDVIALYAKYAVTLGVSKADFINGMQYGNPYDSTARTNWKFATTRSVYGTPEFFLNGVYVTSDNWTYQQWYTLIESLLP